MIYANNGDVVIKGTVPEVLADIDSVLISTIRGMIHKIGKVKTITVVSEALLNSVEYAIEDSEVE